MVDSECFLVIGSWQFCPMVQLEELEMTVDVETARVREFLSIGIRLTLCLRGEETCAYIVPQDN